MDAIKRKYYPRTEVPGFLFRRVKALLDLTPVKDASCDQLTVLSVAEAARNDRMSVADLMIQSQGGIAQKYVNLQDEIGDDITHVVLDESCLDHIRDLSRKFGR